MVSVNKQVSPSISSDYIKLNQKTKENIQKLPSCTPGFPGEGKPVPDIFRCPKLPGACVIDKIPGLFNDADDLIDTALNRALAKYPGAQNDALKGFYHEVKNMTQDQLDEMKDTLVKHLASPDTSERERGLLKKMYDITDAVSEHRQPPHIQKFPFEDHFPKPLPYPMPKHPNLFEAK